MVFGSVCFSLAVGGYMWQHNFMGFMRSAQKACFRAKNGKIYENRPILAIKF